MFAAKDKQGVAYFQALEKNCQILKVKFYLKIIRWCGNFE
jgi:hypothetical protein